MHEYALRSLFTSRVGVGVAKPEMYSFPLFEEEYSVIENAGTKRRREFSGGRAAARSALLNIGLPPVAIPRGPDRLPIWPNGVVGSISHCEIFCCAVVAYSADISGLGIDVEAADPLPSDLASIVFTQRELEDMAQINSFEPLQWAKIGFCAKEAFYKAYFPIHNVFLDFKDVTLNFHRAQQNCNGFFEAKLLQGRKGGTFNNSSFSGKWIIVDGVIICGVMI